MASSARPLAFAAVTAWVLTAGIGLCMLHTWVARGGLRRQRATGVGVPPAVVFGHAGAAVTGLLLWAGFVKTGWDLLAWLAVGLVTTAIGLGVTTVTLWTPYPVAVPAEWGPGVRGARGVRGDGIPPGAGGSGGVVPPDYTVTDEMIAGLLADPFPARPRPRLKPAAFVPVVHGFAALATFMLAVLAAISALLGLL